VDTFDDHIREIEELDGLIKRCEAVTSLSGVNPGSMFGGHPATTNNRVETWRDDRGRSVPVLAKDQSFSLAVADQITERPSFGFGEFMAALVQPSRNADIRAALSESGGVATGDVTVPVTLLTQLIDLMRAKTVCIQAGALTVPIDTETTNIARVAADPTPAWRNEAAAFSVADPTFEKVSFTPKSLGVLVKVSQEILEDSANLNEALIGCFAGAFAVELDRVGLFGTGSAPQPHGISGTSGVGSVDMGTNGLALANYDPIVDAVSALLTANAASPTAAIMAPRTLTKSAKLKDSQNQPLRKPDLIGNLPFLATTSVPINQAHGTSNVASEIIVGDFTQLMFGIRRNLTVRVLRERFLSDNGQIGFLADLRADVQLRHPQSFCEVVGIL
jgi:HK97 family phage major capsid protein